MKTGGAAGGGGGGAAGRRAAELPAGGHPGRGWAALHGGGVPEGGRHARRVPAGEGGAQAHAAGHVGLNWTARGTVRGTARGDCVGARVVSVGLGVRLNDVGLGVGRSGMVVAGREGGLRAGSSWLPVSCGFTKAAAGGPSRTDGARTQQKKT